MMPANANPPAPHALAFLKWDDIAMETLVTHAEQTCGAVYPSRTLSVELTAKTWLPGSLVRFTDGTTGYIALQSAVHKPAMAQELVVYITKFGAASAQRYTRAVMDKEVAAVIMGVLSSPGAPTQNNFRTGKAASEVLHGGEQHYIAPLGSDEDGVGTVSVYGSGITEEMTIGQAIGRYGLIWRLWLPQAPKSHEMKEVPDEDNEFLAANWIDHDVICRLAASAPQGETQQQLAARRQSAEGSRVAEESSERLFHAMRRMGVTSRDREGSLTLGSITSCFTGLFGITTWRDLALCLFDSDAIGMHRAVALIVEVAAIVSQQLADDAWSLPDGLTSQDQRVRYAACVMRSTLRGGPPPPPPPRAPAPPASRATARAGALETPTEGQPQRDAGGAGFDTHGGLGMLGVAANLARSAGGFGQGPAGADDTPPARPPATPHAQLGEHDQQARPPQPTHAGSRDAEDRRLSAPPGARPPDGTAFCARFAASAATDNSPSAEVVDTQFAPAPPAAAPFTDVQQWILALGGAEVQKELATAAGRTLRTALAPLGGVRAAQLSFAHLVSVADSLLENGAWNTHLERPSNWDEAKERLAELLDAVDALRQSRTFNRQAQHVQRFDDPPQAVPFDVEALASGLVRGLKGTDLGKRIRPAENTPTLASAAVVRERGACAAGLARALCAESVIDYEATLGTAAARGKDPLAEMHRLTGVASTAEAQATRALFATGALVTEKTGPLPVNVVDAVASGRNMLRDQIRKARGGPMQRPDVMTADRIKRCDALAEGIAKGSIDLDALVMTLGGTEPGEERPLAGESRDAGTDGDPKSMHDIRDAIDRLIDMLKLWWTDALGISAGPAGDFGIRGAFKRNKKLELNSLRVLLNSGFAYTHERFIRDRETPQSKPPDVVAAWSDAERLDAKPLAQDQSVAAATREHAKAATQALETKMQAMQAQHKKEMADLAAKISKINPRQPNGKRPHDGEVDPDEMAAHLADSKKARALEQDGKKALPPKDAQLPTVQIARQGELKADITKTLRTECPTGNWPCLNRFFDGTCDRNGCRACGRSDKGVGDSDARKACVKRVTALRNKKLLGDDVMDMARKAMSN